MKKLIQGFLFILLVVSFLNLLKVITYTSWPDFTIYYNSAKYVLQHHNPYTLKGIFVGGYLYPPISLLIFYPLLLFPVIIAGKIWIMFSIICFIISFWVLLNMYNQSNNHFLICIAGILGCNYFPVKFTLGMGQLNMVTLLLITLMLYCLQKKKETIAGVLLGTSLTIKYVPLLVIPYLLLRLRTQILLTTFISICGLLILGLILFKPEITFYFLHAILPAMANSVKIDYYNQALSGFLLRDLPKVPIIQLTIIRILISTFLLGISLWASFKTKRRSWQIINLEIGIYIILSLLLNTFSWQHQFVLLLIPLFITYFTIKELKLRLKYYMFLFLCYILTAVNMKNPVVFPVILQSHVFYGAFGLWILNLYLLYRYQN